MVTAPVLQVEPKINQYGSYIFLETIVEADPTPTVRWEKDGAQIRDESPYVIKMEKMRIDNMYRLSVEIQDFDKPLAGVYECLIENEHGRTTATFTVTAGDAPEFTDKPHIIQRDKGKVLAIKIKAKSRARPRVEWTKNDQPVGATNRIKLITKRGDQPNEYILLLEIKGPAKDDEATYTCTVKNAEGSNSQSLDLSFE